ncbi:MAG: hypothetical protein K0S41_3723 [Anaerocolumna sp.]|jgi:hypothetical protein|nr:hypothetical protein [Anaerocolumna sp.]
MIKKVIITVLLTTIICLVYAKTVIAASGLSEAEISILNNLREEFIFQGKVIKIPSFYLNQVENEFRKNDVDLTKEQADVINSKINEAIDIAENINLNSSNIFNQTKAIEKVVLLVKDAASIANYTVSVDIVNKTVKVTDTKGNTINMAKETINQTGFWIYSPVVAILGLLFIFSLYIALMKNYLLLMKVERTKNDETKN